MTRTQAWIKAFRLRTLPLAIASISMGSFLAAYYNSFKWPVFVLSITTTLFLQILSNLANDYGDYVHGADSDKREGPDRAVQSGLIKPGAMKAAILAFVLLSFVSGLMLLQVSVGLRSSTSYIMLAIGILSIIAAVKYTMGKNPYGYSGLGDLFVVLFFGLVGVGGTFFLHTGYLNTKILLPSLSIGLLSAGVLNINNIRDISSDLLAGKKSIPVRIGRSNAIRYHWALLMLPVIMTTIFVLSDYRSPLAFLYLLAVPHLIKNGLGVSKNNDSKKLDPYLKQLALTSLLFIVSFGAGLILSGR